MKLVLFRCLSKFFFFFLDRCLSKFTKAQIPVTKHMIESSSPYLILRSIMTRNHHQKTAELLHFFMLQQYTNFQCIDGSNYDPKLVFWFNSYVAKILIKLQWLHLIYKETFRFTRVKGTDFLAKGWSNL